MRQLNLLCCRASCLCRVASRFPFRLCQLHVAHTQQRQQGGESGDEREANDWKRPGNCTSGTYANRSGPAWDVVGDLRQRAFCQTNCRLQFCQAGDGNTSDEGINKNVACKPATANDKFSCSFPVSSCLFPLPLPHPQLLLLRTSLEFLVLLCTVPNNFRCTFWVQKLHCNG